MAYQGLTSFKQSNERTTIFLLLLFPIFLFVVCWLAFSFFVSDAVGVSQKFSEGWDVTLQIFLILLPVIVIRGWITFFFQKQIMFSFSGAKEVSRVEYPQVYNIVENLCISRGILMPKVGIIDTPGLNAFATGWRAKDSWIVFTSGLINSLDPKELEAVAAHELSHIINKDSLLMLVTVVFIGIISVLGEILIRVRIGGDSKDTRVQMITMVVGLVCLVLGYLMYPLIRLAISRKREFLADAGAVELMKDSQAMISALQKISGHSFVPSAKKQIAMFFINSPVGTSKKSSSIRDTHPSIDERIEALQHF